MRPQWEEPAAPRGGVGFAAPALTSVVKALLIANVALFLVQQLVLQGNFPAADALFSDWFALSTARWREAFPWVPVWQLLTYGFLHGSPGHLLGNMLFLYFLGTMLEGEIGARRFAFFYLLAVMLSGACQLAVGLALGWNGAVVGASGGVLAVVCAVATMRPNTRVIFIIVPLTLKTVALLYVGLDLFGAIQEFKGAASGVANFAHLSGALFGFLAVRLAWIWQDPVLGIQDWRERSAERQEASDDQRLDALLAKIGREGIHALSAQERAFLKRASQRR